MVKFVSSVFNFEKYRHFFKRWYERRVTYKQLCVYTKGRNYTETERELCALGAGTHKDRQEYDIRRAVFSIIKNVTIESKGAGSFIWEY